PGDRQRGGFPVRKPPVAQVLGRLEPNLERRGNLEAEDVLEIARDARSIAIAVLGEDLEFALEAPVDEVIRGRVDSGFLAHLADRGVAERLVLAVQAAGDRLPEP